MTVKYKWLETDKLLKRLSDGAIVPWPPKESIGLEIKDEIDNGEIVTPADVIDPQIAIDKARIDAIDNLIITNATTISLKAMTNAQFDTWWAANVTTLAQANVVLKLLARIVIRRVL